MTDPGRKKTIAELGKFGLIKHLTAGIERKNKSTQSVIGDDSAVIDAGKELTLVSTDLMLEGIHFNLVYAPLKHLGYKAVIRAVSDIYAMNGTPQQLLVSIGISSRFSLENIEDIYEGIKLACEKYRIDLAGGDTTSSLTGLTIGVTCVGSVNKESLVERKGARANDLICVTGNFGASFMGLQLLERERTLFEREKVATPDFSGYEYIIGRQLKPEFPHAIIEELRTAGVKPSSMIDVTDGLASDLMSICKMSGTGCRIFYSKIPVDYETIKAAEELNIDPITPALNGGEDFELLFTVPLEMFESIKALKSVAVIGHMTSEDSDYKIVGDDGSEVALSAQGWQEEK